jgi:4-hydroxythreonine-4-phosphate dehydrogenase
MSVSKPRIAFTLGDPSGVGPEVVAAAWNQLEIHAWCSPIAIGHPEILRRAVALWKTGAKVVVVHDVDEVEPSLDTIPCLATGPDDVIDAPPATIDARSGDAAFQAVVCAAKLAIEKRIDAIVTAPLHKEALHLAGHNYPGHTELLAEMCGVSDFAMMLYLGHDDVVLAPAGLAVVHVTLHTALRKVFEDLTEDAVLNKARLADRFMRRMMNGRRPRVAVCSLNPHGGEGGLFGEEELTIIRPAIQRGLDEGLDLTGPLPNDTVFVHARDGLFDAVVAMYHDQGHIALKLTGMHRAVNVTLGLPIVRTSVAHGTAFDIAWKKEAKITSMIEAVRVAACLAAKSSGKENE